MINCGLQEEWNVADLQRDRLRKTLMATTNKTLGLTLELMININLMPGL